MMKGRTIALLIAVVIGVLAPTTSEGSRQKYTTREFNAYKSAADEANLKLRARLLIDFVESYPASELREYAESEYRQIIMEYLEQGMHSQAVDVGEQYLERLDSKSFEANYLVMWSSFYSQQYGKAATCGEKVYRQRPEAPQVIAILARSYQKIGNIEKAVPFAEMTCRTVKPADCYDLLPMMCRYYAEKGNRERAVESCRNTITAIQTVEKPRQVSESDWNKFIEMELRTANRIIAGDIGTDSRSEPEAESASSAESMIRKKCAEEWPDDFRMQKYCIDKQKDALGSLLEQPSDVPEDIWKKVLGKCWLEWENDFRMTNYCVEKQIEAYRELNR